MKKLLLILVLSLSIVDLAGCGENAKIYLVSE